MGHLWELDVDLSPNERNEHEEFIRHSKFQHILQEAPFFYQIINKPEGYAGDAEMMRIIPGILSIPVPTVSILSRQSA